MKQSDERCMMDSSNGWSPEWTSDRPTVTVKSDNGLMPASVVLGATVDMRLHGSWMIRQACPVTGDPDMPSGTRSLVHDHGVSLIRDANRIARPYRMQA